MVDLEVEVKSARLNWNNRCWRLQFAGIKHGKFDSLVLGILLPWSVQLYDCLDPEALVTCSVGLRNDVVGRSLVFHAEKGMEDPKVAWKQVLLPKLLTIASLKDEWDVTSNVFESISAGPTRAESAYTDPRDQFRHMTPALRGEHFGRLSRLHDRSLVPLVYTSAALPGMTRTGWGKRGAGNSEYDYTRTCTTSCRQYRVEVKSARMSWNRGRSQWIVRFQNVKPAFFDDLVLVVHLPWCVQIWEASKSCIQSRLETNGKSSEVCGFNLCLYASTRFCVLEEAWQESILPKLRGLACLSACYDWGHPMLAEAACMSGLTAVTQEQRNRQ